LIYKLNYPEAVFPLRGNHESRHMTQYFNFRQECLFKYDQDVYEAIINSFDALPISCLLNNKFLAVHGGLGPELKKLKHLGEFDRFVEPPKEGLFCDLLWSDPVDNDKGACKELFEVNETRGCSWFFGKEAVSNFIKKNSLYTIIRAHEVQVDGFKMHTWGADAFPMVLTIFSAPNYVSQYNNKGAVVIFENNTLQIQQFNYSTQPYVLPDFMDVFTWSVPFVMEKISEILMYLAQTTEDNEKDDEPDDKFLDGLQPEFKDKLQGLIKTAETETARGSVVKNKVQAISKMMKMQRLLRENRETIIQIKNKYNNKLPTGILLEGQDGLDAFSKAKLEDRKNESRPKYK
jgi:serine/threonine-protein phosphatase 2B catalytic subunit